MNNQRRKEINEVIKRLMDIKSDIESIAGDEQDYYDNMPENLQGSMRAETSENALDSLYSAIDSIDEISDALTEASN